MTKSLHTPKSTTHRSSREDSTPPSEHTARFAAIANKIPTTEVKRMRVDVALAVLNAARGVEAVLARRADVAELPGISIAQIESLAALGDALQDAAGRVDRFIPVTGKVRALLAQADKIRKTLLTKADVLVLDSVVTPEVVAGIRKGFGPIDRAGDCIALADLFETHAAKLAGRVSVSADDIAAARDIGRVLQKAIKPEHAKRVVSKERIEATDARDRLWTLFSDTWEHHVYRPAVWLFGLAAADQVPMLGARTRGKAADKPEPEPVPTPVPVTQAA